jgi:DNA invertase Pin-like site-specific DNA recombinase
MRVPESQNSVSEVSRVVGYARVSTEEQKLDLQLDALQRRGCIQVYQDLGASGSLRARPGLDQCLGELRSGDILVVWRLDRLGRSLQHLLEIVTDLQTRGVGLISLTENIDTTSASGRLIFSIFGALAEYERQMIQERVKAGIAAAKDRGVTMGRRPALNPSRIGLVRKLVAEGEKPAAVARLLKVGRATVYRALKLSA